MVKREKNNKKAEENKKVKKKKIDEPKKEKIGYFKEVGLELSKVKWPEFKEIVKYSGATLMFCLVLGLFFEALNVIMTFVKGLF